MFDNFKDMSPVTEKSCRLTALMKSSEVDLNGKQQNRRGRLNLRRLKSLCRTSSLELTENFHAITADYKRKKTENGVTYGVTDNYDDKIQEINGENEEVVLSASSKVPLDQLTNSSGRAVVAGSSSSSSSSVMNEVNKVNESLQHATCWSHGVISLIGRRREMEDAVAINLGLLLTKGNNRYDFFGVYDGHGGSSVAHACRDTLHRILVQVVFEEDESVINWEKVMKESFRKMDEEVNKIGPELAAMGSTAVVAVVGEEEVIVANCGDSRAVISRGGVAVPMSIDHKPDRADELDRIENSGGKVINWNGQRVLGVLATSRSIGDNYLKPYVIPDPEVVVSKRSDADEFLILASDGLWDVIPNDVACEITRRCLNGHMRRCLRKIDSKDQKSSEVMEESLAAQAASFLAELAIARGSEDNISVIVVELKRP